MKRVIYAFSGDPITYGHIDIIKRTAIHFDEVYCGIGINPAKHYMFTLEERLKMATHSLSDIPNVKVCSFKGLLVDYAYENNIQAIVKGIRSFADFDYENILHQVGESQKLNIDTFILFARPELSHISSSTVKGILKEQGFIHDYVPLYVKQYLEQKILNYRIIGVTGEICTGKTYICSHLAILCKELNIKMHHIELDDIGHQILGQLQEPRYKIVRKELIDTFGTRIRKDNDMISRNELGRIVFKNSQALKKLNAIMLNPILVRLKRELYGKSGFVVLSAALLAETGMINLCNNNILLIKCDKKVQENRMLQRGLEKSQIKRRIESQYTYREKKSIIEEKIQQDKQGKLWILDNSRISKRGKSTRTRLDVIMQEIISFFSNKTKDLRIT